MRYVKKVLDFISNHKFVSIALVVLLLAFIHNQVKMEKRNDQLMEMRIKYLTALSAEDFMYEYVDATRGDDYVWRGCFFRDRQYDLPENYRISYRTIDFMRAEYIDLRRDENYEKEIYGRLSKAGHTDWKVACFRLPLDVFHDGVCSEEPSYAYVFTLLKESENSPWQIIDFGFV